LVDLDQARLAAEKYAGNPLASGGLITLRPDRKSKQRIAPKKALFIRRYPQKFVSRALNSNVW
jgi:hypothetical protein